MDETKRPMVRQVKALDPLAGEAFPDGVGTLVVILEPQDLIDPGRRRRLHAWIDEVLVTRIPPLDFRPMGLPLPEGITPGLTRGEGIGPISG